MASVRSLVMLFMAALFLGATALTTRPAASSADTVSIARGSVISLQTPRFIQVGKRYAFTWGGGGPAQTYTIKSMREDGWILVEVADENTNPIHFVPGELPTRWLNVATAISIQEMRPHQ